MRPTLSLKKRTPAPADPATPEVVSTPTPESVAVQPAPVAVAAEPEVPVVRRAKLVKVVNVAPPPKANQPSPGADQADKAAQQPAPKPTKVKLAKASKPATEPAAPAHTTDQPAPTAKAAKAKKPTPEERKAAKDAQTEANRRLNEEQRARRAAQGRKLRPFVKSHIYSYAVMSDTVQVDDVECLRPLALGVHKIFFAQVRAMPESEGCSNLLIADAIKSVMYAHVAKPQYLSGMLKFEHRFTLEGNPAEPIDENQRARAQEMQQQRHRKPDIQPEETLPSA
ncbi:ProQ/FINO family protein [Macromonas bipunctata]|uniref:ProQ/FINO family protein n=1 Tax=Macromonas bipunctata TaxID=183670 RepID=UPI0011AF1D8C|nr:ProQ/FINO family protein [Macromonas bipunctata]